MLWDFSEQMKIGAAGEQWFRENYHGGALELVPGASRKGDLVRVRDQKVIELKTDTYSLAKTPNFFMERYSDVHKKTLGGPWRAWAAGADLFVYLYSKDHTYYEFRSLARLVRALDQYVLDEKPGLVYIKNRAWTTAGYKIPREAISTLWKEHTRRP